MNQTNAGFSARQAAHLAGLSKAMIDYLCRHRVVLPSALPCRGRGKQRRYSFGDVVVLRIVARLLQNGISVYRLKSAFSALRRRRPEFERDSLAGALLVTDGTKIYLRQGREVVEGLAQGQMAFAFIVELDGVRREIAARARTSDGKRKLRVG